MNQFETKPCTKCRLRLHFTNVTTNNGKILPYCKYCIDDVKKSCAFCCNECFFDKLCPKCLDIRKHDWKYSSFYPDRREETKCCVCKKKVSLDCNIGLAENHFYYYCWTNRKGEAICRKCIPFERKPRICFHCKLHYNSSNALHRHLRENVSHQLDKLQVEHQLKILHQMQQGIVS